MLKNSAVNQNLVEPQEVLFPLTKRVIYFTALDFVFEVASRKSY